MNQNNKWNHSMRNNLLILSIIVCSSAVKDRARRAEMIRRKKKIARGQRQRRTFLHLLKNMTLSPFLKKKKESQSTIFSVTFRWTLWRDRWMRARTRAGPTGRPSTSRPLSSLAMPTQSPPMHSIGRKIKQTKVKYRSASVQISFCKKTRLKC